jgi:hypothetical protein
MWGNVQKQAKVHTIVELAGNPAETQTQTSFFPLHNENFAKIDLETVTFKTSSL